MRFIFQLAASAVVFVMVGGCSALNGQPFDQGFVGREAYLCCNMGFNPSFEANDANYGHYRIASRTYGAGPTLPVGTKVVVTDVGSSGVAFRPAASTQQYTLSFSYGRKQKNVAEYFRGIFRDESPAAALQTTTPEIAGAINEGRLVEGMTKEEALMTRGYPPAHRTPNLSADEWIYYETPGFADRVKFVDGRLASVTRGPAPE